MKDSDSPPLHTSSRRPGRGPVAALGLSLLLSPLASVQGGECPVYPKPTRSTLALSPTNPQYFRYNNKTLPLIGASAEYLCHVSQPGTYVIDGISRTPSTDFCEFTNYTSYLDSIGFNSFIAGNVPALGLNTIRLWVSLNSSPGLDRKNGKPYPSEAPFTNGCDPWPAACPSPTWNLNPPLDTRFFDRLKCVLDYAWSKDIVVEVTIFDPWQGNHLAGPWKNAFSHPGCFASKDWVDPANGKRCDDTSLHNETNGWAKQRAMIQALVGALCTYPNIYYEVANEADFIPPGFPGLTPAMVRSWHQDMRSTLAAAETTAGCGHLIAANLNEDANLTAVAPTVSVVSTHYTETGPSTTYGANELLRARHNGGAAELNKTFGFNETKYTTDSLPPGPNNDAFQGADTARAEAWEFITSEGAIYDLYGERWQAMSDTAAATFYLKYLNGFLDPLPLDRMSRSLSVSMAQPSWLSGLANYAGGAFRWGAMHSPMTQAGDANVLYIHHSNVQVAGFKRYVAVTGSYTETLSVKLPAGTYRIEWVDPQTGAITLKPNKVVSAAQAGTPISIGVSPTYSYDIALRVTRL